MENTTQHTTQEQTNEGRIDQFKGRVREAVGALLDDDSLRFEGRSEQWAGHAKAAASEAIDELRDFVDSALTSSRDEDSSKTSEEK